MRKERGAVKILNINRYGGKITLRDIHSRQLKREIVATDVDAVAYPIKFSSV